ncbi:MAG: T9SS type A sorting domain-containing protein [Cytophagaceae bacterium]|nr:T9SS type A sorting domain-containing protein [Cytophagaceae bacterium]
MGDTHTFFVPGLAYGVNKIHAVNPPGIEDDGVDSTAEEDENSIQAFRIVRVFSGVVRGRLMSNITNDLGIPQSIPLRGVLVMLKERDGFINENVAEVHTDDNGNFAIPYVMVQSLFEGKQIELFLRIETRNKDLDLACNTQLLLGSVFTAIHNLPGTNSGFQQPNAGTVFLQESAFRGLHWAVQSTHFVRTGFPLSNRLRIIPYTNSSRFSFFPFANIFLQNGDLDHENTIYHEFGHFAMWAIQGETMAIAYYRPGTGGSHSWDEENTSRLAWNEGWADAFQMIMDAAYRQEDQEYGFDERVINRPYYEARDVYPDINNGINSEYYIACAIYDLWDGAGKGLPATIPGTARHGFNDTGVNGWETIDDVELSFFQIILPLVAAQSTGQIPANVSDYYTSLINHIASPANCNLRANISRCFRENRVVYDIARYGTHRTSMSSDAAAISVAHVTDGQFGPIRTLYLDTYRLDYYFRSGPGNSYIFNNSLNKNISDEVLINGSLSGTNSTFLITGGGIYSACGGADINVRQAFLRVNSSTGLTLNENSFLRVQNQGNLVLENNSRITVENLGLVHLQALSQTTLESSEIIVRSGGTLYIRSGSNISLNGTSRIVVEAGGFICIEDPGFNFNLTGQSQVSIAPGAIIGTNPAVIANFGCSTTLCPGQVISVNNEALTFDGVDDFAQVPDNPLLNFGTGDFTIEAIVRSNLTNGFDGIQAILSKRSFAAGANADGYIFGIWSGGQLFVQMAGSPNLLDNNVAFNYNLYDGQCHHVALTRTGNQLQFYVDGQPTTAPLTGRNISSPGVLRIGRNGPSGLFFNGQIGEIRLWDFSRTAGDILNDMDNNITPQAGLVALWDFNGASGQNFADVSGNNLNGFLGIDNSCNPSDPSWVSAGNLACTFGGNFKLAQSSFDDTEEENTRENILEVNAYPNPFNSEISLLISSKADQKVKVTIRGLSGLEVYSNNNLSTNQIITWGESAPSGVYFIQVITETENKIIKIIKN